MLTVGLASGQMQVLGTMLGDTLQCIQDEKMKYPITSFAWKPNKEVINTEQ